MPEQPKITKDEEIISPEEIKKIREKFNKDIADKSFRIEDLENIPEKLHPEVLRVLLDSDLSNLVFQHSEKFKALETDSNLHNRLWSAVNTRLDGSSFDSVEELMKIFNFPKSIHRDFILLIIKYAERVEVARQALEQIIPKLETFTGLDKAVVLALASIDKFPKYFDLRYFSNLDKDTALVLLLNDYDFIVANNIEQFSGLDNDVAQALIMTDRAWAVAGNKDRFKNLKADTLAEIAKIDPNSITEKRLKAMGKEMAMDLIKAGKADVVLADSQHYPGVVFDQALISLLLVSDQTNALVDNLDKFEGLDYEDIAMKLITKGVPRKMIENLEKFKGVDLYKIIKKLIESGYGWTIIEYLDKFPGLQTEIALEMIKNERATDVVLNLNKFDVLDKKVAISLINVRCEPQFIIKNINKFPGLDEDQVNLLALLLDSPSVDQKNFKTSLDKDLAIAIIQSGKASVIAENLNLIEGIDQEIALELIKAGHGLEVMNNLDYFDGIDQLEIAKAMAANGQKGFVKLNREIFSDLSEEAINNL